MTFLEEEKYFFYFIIDPACQTISTELQCYVMDQNCTAQSNNEESFHHISWIMTIGSLMTISLMCCIIIIWIYRQRKANKTKSKLNNMHDLFYL